MANQDIKPYKFDTKSKIRFLEELSLTGRKFHSAAAADITMLTVRAHVDDDPEFAQAYEDAIEIYKESVRAEVRRRGITGWLEPVYHQGQQGFTPKLDENGEVVYQTKLVDQKDEKGNVIGKVEVERPVMVPAYVRKYSDRMLELEAKRVDPAYRDKGQMDVNVTGGILVVPGKSTEEDFEKEYSIEAQRARAAEEESGDE